MGSCHKGSQGNLISPIRDYARGLWGPHSGLLGRLGSPSPGFNGLNDPVKGVLFCQNPLAVRGAWQLGSNYTTYEPDIGSLGRAVIILVIG